jgi:hypothetical protein
MEQAAFGRSADFMGFFCCFFEFAGFIRAKVLVSGNILSPFCLFGFTFSDKAIWNLPTPRTRKGSTKMRRTTKARPGDNIWSTLSSSSSTG